MKYFIRTDEFEELCQDSFDKLKKIIDESLMDARIKSVILVGGSSKITKIKQFLN